jgi:hypothetical protein
MAIVSTIGVPTLRGLADCLFPMRRGELGTGAPYRRRGGHRPQQWGLVAQYVDVSDRLTVGEYHRHISQHLAAIMDRRERPPRTPRRAGQCDRPGATGRHCRRAPPRRPRHQIQTSQLTTKYASPTECPRLETLNRRKSKNSLPDRHFRAFTRRQPPSPVNDPG